MKWMFKPYSTSTAFNPPDGRTGATLNASARDAATPESWQTEDNPVFPSECHQTEWSGTATIADGPELTEEAAQALEARGIDPETAANYGVASSAKHGGNVIEIPYLLGGKVVNRKFRTIASENKRCWMEEGAQLCLWNIGVLSDPTLANEPVVVTEGEFDALVAIQAGYVRTVSVPNGAQQSDPDSGGFAYARDALRLLDNVREIILCVDGDEAGASLLQSLATIWGKARCKWVKYPKGCKDLNDAFNAYGAKGVTETVRRAQFMKVDGIYRMSELPPYSEPKPYNAGFPVLDQHYNVRLGDFCVVTGIPSMGKTAFVNDLTCRLARNHGWSIAVASFEQHPQADHKRNIRNWFLRKHPRWGSAAELDAADAFIDRHFVFMVPSEDDDVTLEWTLERCAASVIQHGVKVVVVDPWNEMDHIRPRDMSLTEYTGFAIKQFKKFARKYGVHLIVVAHPAKQKKQDDGTFQVPTLYDISDSAHWYNKPDVGIVVHRMDETESIIRVAKSRYHDMIGKPGDVKCKFLPELKRFEITDERQLAREDAA